MSFPSRKWSRLVLAVMWLGMLLWFHDNVVIAVTAGIFLAMNLLLAYDAHKEEEAKIFLQKAAEESKRHCDELINQMKSKSDSNNSKDQED